MYTAFTAATSRLKSTCEICVPRLRWRASVVSRRSLANPEGWPLAGAHLSWPEELLRLVEIALEALALLCPNVEERRSVRAHGCNDTYGERGDRVGSRCIRPHAA